MARNGLLLKHEVDNAMTEHECRGRTAVLVAVDGKLAHLLSGLICVFYAKKMSEAVNF